MFRKSQLDNTVLDIEFLLISVVQGVALTALAVAASNVIGNLDFAYWIYIFSGFLIILVFWSQAIIHALSFIDWPLDITHSFLYFLASFIEVIAFNQITNPLKWFGFIIVFFIVVGVLYIFDLSLIKGRKKNFDLSEKRKQLFHHIMERQKFELYFLVPSALLFNVVSFFVIFAYPHFFIEKHYHIILGVLQAIFSILLLVNSKYSFKKRSQLISLLINEK